MISAFIIKFQWLTDLPSYLLKFFANRKAHLNQIFSVYYKHQS